MEGRNRLRYWNGRRQPDRPWRPPLPPHAHGHKPRSVPLWEREFCSYVGNISWQRFCENKQYVSIYPDLEQWDDSGAFENFQNAKTRFWANYHGHHSDIPLPDPDMYIDNKVDHHCKVDPELVADLDKVQLPIDSDNNSAMATGSANAGADNMCTQNQSGDWDIYIEKPVEVNEWWNWETSPGSNAIWGGNNESSSKWGTNNFCRGAALEEPGWHSWSNAIMHQTTGITIYMEVPTIICCTSRRWIQVTHQEGCRAAADTSIRRTIN